MSAEGSVIEIAVPGTPATPPGRSRTRRTPAPWWLWVAAVAVLVPVALPVAGLLVRAAEASDSAWNTLASWRTLQLLVRSLAFTAAVTAAASVIGVTGAWLLARTDLRFRRIWGVAFAMPLVIPSYVVALVLISATGPRGLIADATGLSLPHLIGMPGALLALTISTYPYVYLITAAALTKADPALEDAARGLGASPRRVFATVVLPQLRPAIGAGALLASLYTLSDFGAVSLMRFDVFTRVIYAQYSGRLDRTPAIVLSIVLIVAALVIIGLEQRTRGKGAYFSQKPTRPPTLYRLVGARKVGAHAFLAGVVAVGVIAPVVVLIGWLIRGLATGTTIGIPWTAVVGSLTGGSLAAVAAVAAAVPVVILSVRHSSRATTWLERSVYIIFSLPHITVAIAVIAFTVRYARPVYQSLLVLVMVYAAMFLAQATGPAKASLLQVDPHLDDASRSLGRGHLGTIARVTVPLMSKGLIAGALLVFVTTLKELPATLLLRPSGFTTLSVRIWSAADELLYTQAAASALLLIAVSVIPVYYLSIKPKDVTEV
ncbi:MAG TPA: iron ABC transporter permease [Acidimicrobiia bacterium]|nr:iron ABC transporter permease [Acidimicrobiia bacterium]